MESINRGVEVRRIHIVYFLCRNGAIEQPHLVRVHHLHYRGVRLRDVKRWLSELRGHDMPDSFAWSYKRRYRGCCVWQDLSDDDLITPISDNEYVLKGSLLPSLSKTMDPFFASEEKKRVKEEEEGTKTAPETIQMDGSILPKPPPQSDESSPPRPPQLWPLGSEEKDRAAKSRFFSMGSWKRETRGNEFISNGENVRSGAGSHRQAATSVIRKLIGGCMAVETKDSEIRIVQRQDTMSRVSSSIESERQHNKLFENDQKLPYHMKSYRSSSSVPVA